MTNDDRRLCSVWKPRQGFQSSAGKFFEPRQSPDEIKADKPNLSLTGGVGSPRGASNQVPLVPPRESRSTSIESSTQPILSELDLRLQALLHDKPRVSAVSTSGNNSWNRDDSQPYTRKTDDLQPMGTQMPTNTSRRQRRSDSRPPTVGIPNGNGGMGPKLSRGNNNYVSNKPRLDYIVFGNLSQAGKTLVDSTFSDVDYRPRKDKGPINPHATCAAIRSLAEVTCYMAIQKAMRTSPGERRSVMDIGGAPIRGVNRASMIPNLEYHSCNPIIEPADLIRERARQNAKVGHYCNHTFAECNCTTTNDFLLAIDVLYYIDPQLLMSRMSPSTTLYGCAHTFQNTEGTYPVPSETVAEGYAVIGQPNKLDAFKHVYRHWESAPTSVIMKVNGNDHAYTHPLFRVPQPFLPGTGRNTGWCLVFSTLFQCGTYVGFMAVKARDHGLIYRQILADPMVDLSDIANKALAMGRINTKDELVAWLARYIDKNNMNPSSLPFLVDNVWRKVAQTKEYSLPEAHSQWAIRWRKAFGHVFYNRKEHLTNNVDEYPFGGEPPPAYSRRTLEFYPWAEKTRSPEPSDDDHDLDNGGLLIGGGTMDPVEVVSKECGEILPLMTLEEFLSPMASPTPQSTRPTSASSSLKLTDFSSGQAPSRFSSEGDWVKERAHPAPSIPEDGIYDTKFTRNIILDTGIPDLEVGQLIKTNETINIKPKVDWATVVSLNVPCNARPDKTEETVLAAVKLRLGQGTEHSKKQYNEEVLAKYVFPVQWCPMSPEHWLKYEYGKRDDKQKVAMYERAFKAIESGKKTISDRLHVQAFIKDEVYPGKVAYFKPRLVQNIADVTQVALQAVFTSGLTQAVKKYCRQHDELIYSSGFTPSELGAWTVKYEHFPFAIENDFSSYEATLTVEGLASNRAWYERSGCPPHILEGFKKYELVYYHLDGWLYIREGSRASGTPDTSLGNTGNNASVHVQSLYEMGFILGRDYVMMVQGDDNLILCTAEVVAAIKVLDSKLREFGTKPGLVVRRRADAQDWAKVEFCSCRFVSLKSEVQLVPKIGRLLVKGISIPHNADTHFYITPMLEQYLYYSGSSLIRYFAYVWLRYSGKSRSQNKTTYPEPEVLPEHCAIYGITPQEFKLSLGTPNKDGTWLIDYHSSTIKTIVDMDCPIDDVPDKINTYRPKIVLSAPIRKRSKVLPESVVYQRKMATLLKNDNVLSYDPGLMFVDPYLYEYHDSWSMLM